MGTARNFMRQYRRERRCIGLRARVQRPSAEPAIFNVQSRAGAHGRSEPRPQHRGPTGTSGGVESATVTEARLAAWAQTAGGGASATPRSRWPRSIVGNEDDAVVVNARLRRVGHACRDGVACVRRVRVRVCAARHGSPTYGMGMTCRGVAARVLTSPPHACSRSSPLECEG